MDTSRENRKGDQRAARQDPRQPKLEANDLRNQLRSPATKKWDPHLSQERAPAPGDDAQKSLESPS